jgi:hypothetical protein
MRKGGKKILDGHRQTEGSDRETDENIPAGTKIG